MNEVFQGTKGELFREAQVVIEVSALDAAKLISAAEAQQLQETPEVQARYSLRVRLLWALQAGLQDVLLKLLSLPAERNAFVITYEMLANRRYRARREGLRGRGARAPVGQRTPG
ncbi:MAG: hypothetical protein MUF34_31345 [Polyangiaceae bacterium]|nr:hypothetical protein [Polyangiaceae bacterium]